MNNDIELLPDENGELISCPFGTIAYQVTKAFEIRGYTVGRTRVELGSGPVFATSIAAEQYVRENEPVYPRALVDLMQGALLWGARLSAFDFPWKEKIDQAIDRYHTFKEKNNL